MSRLFSLVTKFSKASIILVLGIVQCVVHEVEAQLPFYSQYTFNAFLLNPAVAGAEAYDAVNITSREQWLGMDGAPRTYAVSYQTRILKRKYMDDLVSVKRKHHLRSGRVGLGMYLYNAQAGQKNETGAQFTYAYHLATYKSQLSFGWTLSLVQGTPDFNAGVYYSDRNKFFGLSILQLTDAAIKSKYSDWYRFYFTGGYQYSLSELHGIEPSVFFKFSETLNKQVDATLKYIYKRKFWVGLGYRSGTTFIGSVGLNISKFHVGYAFDYSPHGVYNQSYGSHELMMALKLGDNARRYKWIERY